MSFYNLLNCVVNYICNVGEFLLYYAFDVMKAIESYRQSRQNGVVKVEIEVSRSGEYEYVKWCGGLEVNSGAITLIMEAASTSQMSVNFYHTTTQ
jgi:hypothetical protein